MYWELLTGLKANIIASTSDCIIITRWSSLFLDCIALSIRYSTVPLPCHYKKRYQTVLSWTYSWSAPGRYMQEYDGNTKHKIDAEKQNVTMFKYTFLVLTFSVMIRCFKHLFLIHNSSKQMGTLSFYVLTNVTISITNELYIFYRHAIRMHVYLMWIPCTLHIHKCSIHFFQSFITRSLRVLAWLT